MINMEKWWENIHTWILMILRDFCLDGCWIAPRSSTLMLQCGKVGISQALACLGGVGAGLGGWLGFDDGWVF